MYSANERLRTGSSSQAESAAFVSRICQLHEWWKTVYSNGWKNQKSISTNELAHILLFCQFKP
jgi:hypothetical protein